MKRITAKKIRKITDNAQNETLRNEQYKSISRRIQERAEEGEDSLVWIGEIHPKVRQQLIDDGFIINDGLIINALTFDSDKQYKIKW
jgi:hypothetical protein